MWVRPKQEEGGGEFFTSHSSLLDAVARFQENSSTWNPFYITGLCGDTTKSESNGNSPGSYQRQLGCIHALHSIPLPCLLLLRPSAMKSKTDTIPASSNGTVRVSDPSLANPLSLLSLLWEQSSCGVQQLMMSASLFLRLTKYVLM